MTTARSWLGEPAGAPRRRCSRRRRPGERHHVQPVQHLLVGVRNNLCRARRAHTARWRRLAVGCRRGARTAGRAAQLHSPAERRDAPLDAQQVAQLGRIRRGAGSRRWRVCTHTGRISVSRCVDCRLRAAVRRTVVRVLRRPQHAQRAAGAVVDCVAAAVRVIDVALLACRTARSCARACELRELFGDDDADQAAQHERPAHGPPAVGVHACSRRVLAGEEPTPSHGRAAPPHPAHPPAAATRRAAPRTGARVGRRC